MSTNAFVRLQRLLPPAPVLVGRVEAHHPDDTSTIRLPTQQGTVELSGGLSTGSILRARGTTVPVGANAFVRNGVVETQAPDEPATEIVVGRVTVTATPVQFTGTIPNQTGTVGVAFSLALASYWSGGDAPLTFAVAAGSLPAGLTLDANSGVISGTPTTADTITGLAIRAADRQGYAVDSPPFTFTIADPAAVTLWLDTFESAGSLASRNADSGQSYVLGMPSESGGTFGSLSNYVVQSGYLTNNQSLLEFNSPARPNGVSISDTTKNYRIEADIQIDSPFSAGVYDYRFLFGFCRATRDDFAEAYHEPESSAGVNVLLNGSYITGNPAFPFNTQMTVAVELRNGFTEVRYYKDGVLYGTRTRTVPPGTVLYPLLHILSQLGTPPSRVKVFRVKLTQFV